MPILFYAHVLNPNFYYCILINKADHTFHFHAYEKFFFFFWSVSCKKKFHLSGLFSPSFFVFVFVVVFVLAKQKWSTLL